MQQTDSFPEEKNYNEIWHNLSSSLNISKGQENEQKRCENAKLDIKSKQPTSQKLQCATYFMYT